MDKIILKDVLPKNMSNILNSVYIQSLYVEVVSFGPIKKKSKDRVVLFAVWDYTIVYILILQCRNDQLLLLVSFLLNPSFGVTSQIPFHKVDKLYILLLTVSSWKSLRNNMVRLSLFHHKTSDHFSSRRHHAHANWSAKCDCNNVCFCCWQERLGLAADNPEHDL